MKSRPNPLLRFVAAVAIVFNASAHAADLTWDNGTTTGNWNTTDANWTGSVWNNGTPDNAIFNTSTGTINLTEPITAGNFTFGTLGANTTGTCSGSSLAITGNLTALADGNNGPGGPTLSFSNRVTVGGDLAVGRRVVEITGGTFTVNRTISASSWGRLLVSSGTVTVATGIDDSLFGGNTLSVFLQGGALYTPYIKTTSAGFTSIGNDGVVLSGGMLVATAHSSDFIQTWDPGWGNRNDIGVGTAGANIDTNGFDITITKAMVNFGGAGTLTKSGSGTLKLTAYQHYTGGTTVNAGTLEVAGATGGWGLLRGAVTVNAGATLAITGGDGTGFGWNNPATSLTINGGTVNASGSSHVGFGSYTTVSLNDGGTIAGNWQWNGNSLLGFSSSGDSTNTISGNLNLRADAGANHTFNVADGAATVDLQVNANLFDQYPEVWWVAASGLTKAGAGTMVLAGTNSYNGTTIINEGTLSFTFPTLDDIAGVTIASGAKIDLNFEGSDTVGNLEIDGSGPLPAGIYNSNHPTYGSYFTGTGSLVVPGADGTWASLADGNWGDAANWTGNTVAVGFDATATFNGATGVIVTVDSNRKIGNLAFDISDYTLAGAGTLTLDSSATPTIGVTTGRTATISANLGGTSGMEKTGAGTLVLTGVKTYTGGTTVTAGTLELAGGNSGNSIIRGALAISPGAAVALTGGDGSGFGWNNPVTSINIDGGTLNAAGSSHLGFGSYATMTLGNGSSIQGSWQWNGDGLLGLSSHGDSTNTISGSLNLRADAGASHTFNVADGAAATDLRIDANLTDQWPEYQAVSASGLTKSGAGTIVLNGTNSYDGNTLINDGALEVTAAGSLHFRPTTNGATNSVSGTATASLSFLGTVDLDLGAADATGGNLWNLFNLGSFTGPTPVLTPTAVTSNLGSFTEVSSGVWELAVTGAKWIFTEADGNLAYTITATDYSTWRTANGVAGGVHDDDDSDGITNFEEYAFGLDPTGGSSLNAITVPLDQTTGTLSYTRRRQSLTGLTYTVWYSTDLAGWTEDTSAAQGTPVVNGDVETVPVTLTGSLLTNPKLFIQVRAE